MDKAFKSIKHGLEKDIKQYAQNMDKGTMQTTDKDPERLFHLMGAMAFAKILCLLEEMKEGGEKEGKGGMGGMLHAMGKQMGGQGGGMSEMMRMLNIPSLPQIGFDTSSHHIGPTPYGNNYDHEMRRGVPGSGRRAEMDDRHMNYDNYGEMDDDTEMRRGRSRSTGRYVHRAELDGNEEMNMDGRGGSSGGQGNTGGTSGRR